jgi:hypothetical protein
VVTRNLVMQHAPRYSLQAWAGGFDAGLLGLTAVERSLKSDDRVGRALEHLFHSDRGSLLTRLVLNAVRAYKIDLSQLHNDSTAITFTGAYRNADGRPKAGRSTLAIKDGHNKDDRPDLKQRLWILTVSTDGAVPIAYRAMDGNTHDAGTHIQSWEELVALTRRRDFMYVADAKLATRPNMTHIHKGGGRFISLLSVNRKEDERFRMTSGTPARRPTGARSLLKPSQALHAKPLPPLAHNLRRHLQPLSDHLVLQTLSRQEDNPGAHHHHER